MHITALEIHPIYPACPDFNASPDVYTMCQIIWEPGRFPVAGRVEDLIDVRDGDGYPICGKKR